MERSIESDIDLLEAWRAGDEAASRALIRRHAPAITRFFNNKLYDRQMVSELAWDTFLRARDAKATIRTTVRKFLFGVARMVLLRYINNKARRLKREKIVAKRIEEGTFSINQLEPDPESFMEISESKRLVQKAIRRLSIDDQLMLELRYWEEMKTRDIGELLDIPERTATTRIIRAKKRLAAKLVEIESSRALLEETSKTQVTWLEELADHLEGKLSPGGGE